MLASFTFFYSCEKEGESGNNQDYYNYVVGKWISYLEIHHSIRKSTMDTLETDISFDTNLLVFGDRYLLTYLSYPTDTVEYIQEYIRSVTGPVLFFGGYEYNTGEILYANNNKLIFKRFKGVFVPVNSSDTIHHYLTYYCNRIP